MSIAPVPAILALADGTLFHGQAIGAPGASAGEVVFNTAMTGYQEILTDPSYARQIVTLTYPHVGNTGVNAEDVESRQIHAAGLVIRDLPRAASNWRSTQDARRPTCATQASSASAGIDTRKLTRMLREQGRAERLPRWPATAMREAALHQARASPRRRWPGIDLAKVVSCSSAVRVDRQHLGARARATGQQGESRFHVVAYDYGIKHNILRMLAERGCRGHGACRRRRPAAGRAARSSPTACSCPTARAIRSRATTPSRRSGVSRARHSDLRHLPRPPDLGLAVGRQDAEDEVRPPRREPSGAGQGHRPGTHHRQNHGFAVDPATLPANARVTHVSLFDGSAAGHRAAPTSRRYCFQGHPEASPGPHDIGYLFDRFIRA